MASFAPAVKHAPNSLAEVFDAAWVIIGHDLTRSTIMRLTNLGWT